MLESPKASRRHAIINLQNVGEFWLIDLGSSNGTFLNKRRVHQPVRLCTWDQITVGDSPFTFRQPEEITSELRTTIAQQTIRETANIPVWLCGNRGVRRSLLNAVQYALAGCDPVLTTSNTVVEMTVSIAVAE